MWQKIFLEKVWQKYTFKKSASVTDVAKHVVYTFTLLHFWKKCKCNRCNRCGKKILLHFYNTCGKNTFTLLEKVQV